MTGHDIHLVEARLDVKHATELVASAAAMLETAQTHLRLATERYALIAGEATPSDEPPHGVVADGLGSEWPRCKPDCQLEVVRPGKVQCVPCDDAATSPPTNGRRHERL